MLTIAVTNQKGGVGKTGVAVCLAGVLVDQGYKVLLIDLEPQATATEWLGARPAGEGRALPEDTYGPQLLEALLNSKALTPYQTRSGIDLVASGNALGGFEITAGTSFPTGERELLLRRAFEPLPALWDVVFIDCPPSLGLLTVNALAAADSVMIPVKLDSASRTPLVRLFIAAEEIHQDLNPRLDCLGVAGTFYKKTGNHQADMMDWLRSQFAGQGQDDNAEDLVFRTAIRDNTHIGESHGFQMPVTHYVREQKIRRSNGVEDFLAFGQEFIERAELAPPQSAPPVHEETR